ncbi:MAG: acetolactate synthase small subunit [Firmicutes bacterium]|jgi:acetolactate synthase-1/3 small subunit|nr:acetolactate synthase small subunit [Bacillota bacterium]
MSFTGTQEKQLREEEGTELIRPKSSHHLLAIKVENKFGVLSRVAGLFSRRGFNIVSLAVAPTEDERFSRISIVVDAESAPLEQVVSQLNKLINVVEIKQLHPDDAIEAELLLATLKVDKSSLVGIEKTVTKYKAHILEKNDSLITISCAGTPTKLDELENLLQSYEIVALHRTGQIALPKLEFLAK